MTNLTTLRDRIAEAKGPDRELDGAITRHFKLTRQTDFNTGLLIWNIGKAKYPSLDDEHPDFTASVDACLALIEKVLPGRQVNLHIYSDTMAVAYFGAREEYRHSDDILQPAPLALLLALFNALEAKNVD